MHIIQTVGLRNRFLCCAWSSRCTFSWMYTSAQFILYLCCMLCCGVHECATVVLLVVSWSLRSAQMHPQLCLLVAQMCTRVHFCFETKTRENVAHDRASRNLMSSSSTAAFQTGTYQTRELRQDAQNGFDRLLNILMFCSPIITIWSEVVLTLCSCSSCFLSPCMHAHNAINEKHCVTGQG